MNKRQRILFPIGTAALILMSVISCNKTAESKETISNEKYVSQINSMNEFQNIVESNNGTLLVFDLYADWCAPCKILAPTFNSLASVHNERVKFFRVNVDKHPDIASVFSTRAIPLVVFVRDKEAVHSLAGVNPREEYERVIIACGSAESNESCKKNLGNTL